MNKAKIQKLIALLGEQKTTLFQKDFLLTWRQTDADLRAVILAAEALEEMYRANIDCRVFRGSLAVSNFRDKSTRTRFSFSSAASLLGLSFHDFDESKSQVAHGETVLETANMISFLTEIIGIRDDLFIGEGHEYQAEVSKSVQMGYDEGILPQRPAVINLQCDRDHPTQSMADLLHVQKLYGGLENLRGKKVAMTWAYSPAYAKPLSVPQAIITVMSRYGMNVALAHPPGFELQGECLEAAKKHAAASGGSFTVCDKMEDAFKDADIVYPKNWGSMELMNARTTALRAGKAGADKMKEIEQEGIAKSAKYKGWECTEKMMGLTKGGKAHYMHCLPADITDVNCKEGEVAKTVFERYRKETYNEAEHKLYGIAAMMLLTRFEHPAKILGSLLAKADPRRAE
jgi:knotted carbamoyltransferase YgeW